MTDNGPTSPAYWDLCVQATGNADALRHLQLIVTEAIDALGDDIDYLTADLMSVVIRGIRAAALAEELGEVMEDE